MTECWEQARGLRSETPDHIGALDGVRALSIILIILPHIAPRRSSAWNFKERSEMTDMSRLFYLSGFLVWKVQQTVPAVQIYDIDWHAAAEIHELTS